MSDNFFRVVSLNLFIISSWTNLINSNVIYNHIFIYYRDNHKCKKYIIYLVPKSKQYNFLKNSKGKLVKILIFNKILCIIKNYIKSENFSFSFKQTFSNQKFSTIQSKPLSKHI